jgi:NADH-quinone oxidoreductase subunit G
VLKQITDGDHPLCNTLKNVKKPMIIIGDLATTQDDFEATQYHCRKLLSQFENMEERWNGYNILHRAASRVGGLDIGFIPKAGRMNTKEILKKCEVIFSLGADEIDVSDLNPKAFMVYIGHHGDKMAEMADIILPAASFAEKNATYVNLEGRVQNTWAAIDPLGQAKVDWEIILYLAKLSGIVLPYSNLTEIRSRMAKVNSVFKHTDQIIRYPVPHNTSRQKEFTSDVFSASRENYYLTNSICRSSRTMHKCSEI